MSTDVRSDSRTGRRIEFGGGLRTLLGLVVVFAVLAVAAVVLEDALSSVEFPVWVDPVAQVAKFGLLAGIALGLLRIEGVSPLELGLAKRNLLPAVVTVAGVYVALNLLAVGVAVATGAPWGVGVLLDMPVVWADVPAPRVTTLLFQFLVVAVVEEFVFRGYLQSKVVALVGDGSTVRIGLGVLTASLVFGAMHAPGAIVAGASPSGVLFTVLFLSLSGIFFGVLYELTHNVYLVAMLHAIGNVWPLVGDIWAVSGVAFLGSLLGVAIIYFGATVAYRYWGRGIDHPETSDVVRTHA